MRLMKTCLQRECIECRTIIPQGFHAVKTTINNYRCLACSLLIYDRNLAQHMDSVNKLKRRIRTIKTLKNEMATLKLRG